MVFGEIELTLGAEAVGWQLVCRRPAPVQHRNIAAADKLPPYGYDFRAGRLNAPKTAAKSVHGGQRGDEQEMRCISCSSPHCPPWTDCTSKCEAGRVGPEAV